MNFTYSRRVRFPDTDAAGVVYFANYLSICHEAYEEALADRDIELKRLFNDSGVMIPIAQAHCDYLRPLQCGDSLEVEVSPELVKESEFKLNHKIFIVGSVRKLAATAQTTHVCIDATTRRRTALPANFLAWVDHSSKAAGA